MNDDAVSEVVGALMVILLIVLVAGFIYTIAYPIIMDNEETIRHKKAYFDLLEISEKIENVRSGFEFTSSYFLRLSGVSFSFQNEPIVFLNNNTFNLSSIKVSGKGWELYYENGAIFERSSGDLRVLYYPNIYYDVETDTLTLPVIKFNGSKSLGGTGTIMLNLRLENISKLSLSNCNIKIISSNSEGWKNFLREIGIDITGSEIDFTVSSAEVTIYEVRIE
ncbi:MAG: hypothetical protein QXY19_06275 [Archaeoglobaceae archaeon]